MLYSALVEKKVILGGGCLYLPATSQENTCTNQYTLPYFRSNQNQLP